MSAQAGVSSYLACESRCSAAVEFVSSVKAASHRVRDAAARMIVGSGMLLSVAAVDVGLRLDVTTAHSAMILQRVLAAALYVILWMLLVHQRVAQGAYSFTRGLVCWGMPQAMFHTMTLSVGQDLLFPCQYGGVMFLES